MTESLIYLEKEGVTTVQKFGNSIPVNQHLDTLGELLVIADLRRLVKHLDEKFLVARTLHHSSILVLLLALGISYSLLTGIIQGHYPIFNLFNCRLVHNKQRIFQLIIHIQISSISMRRRTEHYRPKTMQDLQRLHRKQVKRHSFHSQKS